MKEAILTTASFERGDTDHTRILAQDVFHAVRHLCRHIHIRARREVYLHGKLVAIGNGQDALGQTSQHHGTHHDRNHADSHRYLGMSEALAEQPVVMFLQEVEEVKRLLAVFIHLYSHRLADKPELHERHK